MVESVLSRLFLWRSGRGEGRNMGPKCFAIGMILGAERWGDWLGVLQL
jgi:hypothetical protein